eukprot:c19660_g1_i1 orf=237-698(+)
MNATKHEVQIALECSTYTYIWERFLSHSRMCNIRGSAFSYTSLSSEVGKYLARVLEHHAMLKGETITLTSHSPPSPTMGKGIPTQVQLGARDCHKGVDFNPLSPITPILVRIASCIGDHDFVITHKVEILVGFCLEIIVNRKLGIPMTRHHGM